MFTHRTLNSYAILFFAEHRGVGILLLLATFLVPMSGISGLCAVWAVNGLAAWAGQPKAAIDSGLYGFNAMLVGVGLGAMYVPNMAFVVVWLGLVVLCYLVTLLCEAVCGQYRLPFLSMPFLISYWAILLAAPRIGGLLMDTSHIYFLNYLYALGGKTAIDWYNYVDNVALPPLLDIYLKTLSSVFFQHNIVCGAVIALAVLWYSRIAFTLSWVGFGAAFVVFHCLQIDTFLLTQYHAGFNFVLLAIALGGFYTIPSASSYAAAAIAVLVGVFVSFAVAVPFTIMTISPMTLPFVVVTWLFLFFFNTKTASKYPELVVYQYLSPEKNLYQQALQAKLLLQQTYYQLRLPFWGEWIVTQGHNGSITHLGEWSKALDFVIVDDELRAYADEGSTLTDYYCYNKPVTAPAAGFIEAVIDWVGESEIGAVNTAQNWGNSVVIKHSVGFYTQLSHLRPATMRFKVGDYVQAGDVIADCGSSGRSPSPHLHFQAQIVPLIGAKTLDYPVAYYMERQGKQHILHSFDRPQEGQLVSNIVPTTLLQNALYFYPTLVLNWRTTDEKGNTANAQWECFTDAYNKTYLQCSTSKAIAYFVNDGTMFYFTHFEGQKNTLLYSFYLGAYKLLLGYYQDLALTEIYPLHHFNPQPFRFFNDFIAPFVTALRATYRNKYEHIDFSHHPNFVEISAHTHLHFFGYEVQKIKYNLIFTNQKIATFTVENGAHKTVAVLL
jgi:urea transporter